MITVGIVEDDKGIREALKFYLDKDKHHFGAVYAFNSVEAILAQTPLLSTIQIVVLDINLPGMSGINGIKPIKDLMPNAHIMMITVLDDDDCIYNALCSGAVGYIKKETPLDKIKDAIIALNKGEAPIPPPAIARKIVAHFKQEKKQTQSLTSIEMDIIQGIVDGLSYQLIADRMAITPDAVGKHILSTYGKLYTNTRG